MRSKNSENVCADFETNMMFVKRYSKKGGLILLVTFYRYCVFEVFTLI